MGAQRRILAALAVASAAVAAVHGLTGAAEVVLYAAPLLLLVGFLLSGRFVGEALILARRAPARRRHRAPAAHSWPRHRRQPLTSALARRVPALRGPPAPLPAA